MLLYITVRMVRKTRDYPEEFEVFFELPGCLQAFARMIDRLQENVSIKATKIATRLVIVISKQIADAGYRASKLKLISGFRG